MFCVSVLLVDDVVDFNEYIFSVIAIVWFELDVLELLIPLSLYATFPLVVDVDEYLSTVAVLNSVLVYA